jgi:hypothetical protein
MWFNSHLSCVVHFIRHVLVRGPFEPLVMYITYSAYGVADDLAMLSGLLEKEMACK